MIHTHSWFVHQRTLITAALANRSFQETPIIEKLSPTNGSPQLHSVITSANDFFDEHNKTLHFSVDKDSGKTVVKLIDTDTGKLIRQTPTESALKLSEDIAQIIERISGGIIEEEA
ncbi:flagellar protein FlaG [Pseudomonadota bacterium]